MEHGVQSPSRRPSGGFEPPTFGSTARRPKPLSYPAVPNLPTGVLHIFGELRPPSATRGQQAGTMGVVVEKNPSDSERVMESRGTRPQNPASLFHKADDQASTKFAQVNDSDFCATAHGPYELQFAQHINGLLITQRAKNLEELKRCRRCLNLAITAYSLLSALKKHSLQNQNLQPAKLQRDFTT